jgi:hypothetical protein
VNVGFDLSQYATVEERLALFWEAHPNGRIHTEIAAGDFTSWICFKAEIYRDATDRHPVATGYAFEERTERGVNQTSWIENAETSALGRAAANWIFQAGKRPSREEMGKVERMGGDPQPSADEPSPAQIRLLRALKYQGDPKALTRREASQTIDRLKTEQQSQEHPF